MRNVVCISLSVPGAQLQLYKSCDSYVPNKLSASRHRNATSSRAITYDQQRTASSSEYHAGY
jgi:hypothetical protein